MELGNFGEVISKFFTDKEKKIADFKSNMKEIEKSYMDTCDYFMINKNDSKRKPKESSGDKKGEEEKSASCEFFEFFTGFFDKVDTAIKQKPKKAGGAKAKMGAAVNQLNFAAMI